MNHGVVKFVTPFTSVGETAVAGCMPNPQTV